jgi:UDP:flavonoid glycosyltransferase YjiC (YdhE family)
MAHVLVGYERGNNLGHYWRLVPVAEALAAEGHQVTLFLRNPYDCRGAITRNPLPFIQSPDLVAPNPAEREHKRMGSYSDIMVYGGFGSLETLFTATLGWHTIFDSLRPDLIVCDHSPLLCFAAYGRIPIVQVGDGFTIPPAQGDAFPGLQRHRHATVPVERIVAVMNQVQSRLGGPQIATVTAPLRTAARLVCTLTAFDPYRDTRIDPVIGPTEGLQAPTPIPEKPHIFAYLGLEHQVTRKLLGALMECDLPAEVYIRGMTAEIAAKYQRPGLVFFDSLQPIDQLLERTTLAIHHGGSGMSLACCSVGRPQIVLPVHDENLMYTQALERVGIAELMTQKDLENGGGARIAAFDADTRRRARAGAIAEEIRKAGPFRPMDHILQACRAALGNA